MAVKSISRSVTWQLCGKIALEGIAFFTTPIFTRLLSPEEYGFVSLYISWLSIFGLLIGLCINGSIGNARIEYSSSILPKYLSSILTISVISFIIFLFLFVFWGQYLENIIKLKKNLLILLCVHSFSSFILNFEITRLNQLKKVEKATILSLSYSIICITTSLIFVVITKRNQALAKIYGQAMPTIIYGFILLIFIYFKGKKVWSNDYSKFCLSLTLPLIFHQLGHLIFSQSDRLMLQRMLGDDVLGVYSVSFTLCGVLSMIFGALNSSWVPFYYDYKKNNENETIIVHTRRYLKFYTLITIGFLLLSYDVFKIIAPKSYYSGMKIIPLLVISIYFSFLYLFPVNFEFYKLKTKLIPVATFSAALLNIIINYLLIPRYGFIGAAIGTVVSHIILFLFHEIIARFIIKNFEYPWHIYFPGICCVVIFSICSFLLKDLVFIRWGLFFFVSLYLFIDILKNKSLF